MASQAEVEGEKRKRVLGFRPELGAQARVAVDFGVVATDNDKEVSLTEDSQLQSLLEILAEVELSGLDKLIIFKLPKLYLASHAHR